MLHITDSMIDAAVHPMDAQDAVLRAFQSFGNGEAAMQERIRTESGGLKLSTMAAVLPHQGYAGAKVYTTLGGQFSFVILLFDARDGKPLASLEANAITRLRTAACTVLAARHLARPQSDRLAIFGAGVQGRAHAAQLAQAFPIVEVRFCDPFVNASAASAIAHECGVPVRFCSGAQEALEGADIVVTASRSVAPLFDGASLPPGCFVAAIGSSLPHTRELDDAALARFSCIAVDWAPQTLREAGDIAQASPEALPRERIVEFADLVSGKQAGRTNDAELTLYKAVGVALPDIAVAGLAYERIAASR